MRRSSLTLVLVALGAAQPLRAQLSISGQVDLTQVSGYDSPLNRAFRGDDPFNEVRLRLFGQHWVNDRIGIFTELLFDIRASARVNGAYVVINQVADKEWLDARIGLAPSPLGNFGMRSTYFTQNSVIGVPLLWHYRTSFDGDGRSNPTELTARRDANSRGIPVMYDACWPILVELSGAVGIFEFNIGGTSGSISNPMSSLRVPGWQALSRVGVRPTPGLSAGISAAYGPYIGAGPTPALVSSPTVSQPEDYRQLLLGYDFEYARGRMQIFSEAYLNTWEAPNVAEDLKVTAGYVEARVDVAPNLYIAGRLGGMDFSTIDVGGQSEDWDDDVWRWESAIGYRMAREVLVRVGWQHWRFVSGIDPNQDVLAIQLSAVF